MQLYVVGYKDMDFFLKYQEFLHFFAKRGFVTGYCAKITWLIMGSRNHSYFSHSQHHSRGDVQLTLLVIVDDRIDKVHHVLGGFEHGFNLVKLFFALVEVVRNLVPTAIVLHSQILDVRPVARESRGAGLQFFQSETLWLVPRGDVRRRFETAGLRASEILLECLVLHTFQPIVGIGHDFVSTRGQDIRRQPVVATGHHTMAGFQMQVIAAV